MRALPEPKPADAPATAPDCTPSPPTQAEIDACVRVLRAIDADRSHLTRLTQGQRRELLTLAGLVAKPERADLVKMAKAFRRAERQAAKHQDRLAIEATGLRRQRLAPAYAPLWLAPPEPEELADAPELRQAQHCYVCKQPFAKLHRYYDSLCADCGDFNYAKRTQSADLEGHYALVTGARVKIGYQTALKLLRAGAHVIVTTRFPVDAVARYAAENDFPQWRERLQIHGLDLRHTPSVELFTRYLLARLPRLDHVINNACQTVRRPAAFFEHLLAQEKLALAALPPAWRGPLAGHAEVHGVAFSQHRDLDADFRDGQSLFPRDAFDSDGQQIDLRELNSWRLRLHEVETSELLEVHFVNAIAPFILNARLKPLLLRTPERHKHIVNVSAMEGQFYRTTKTDKHPHTNMAKAALNMMTRTSAPDFVKDGIHMNAVDTGWISDEDPAVHAARKAELGFAPPLDIIDGAARILDPLFVGRRSGTHVWGQFLKDYKPAPW